MPVVSAFAGPTPNRTCRPGAQKDRRIGNNPFVMAVPPQGGASLSWISPWRSSPYGQMENKAMRGELLPVPGGYDEQGNLSR